MYSQICELRKRIIEKERLLKSRRSFFFESFIELLLYIEILQFICYN